MCEEQGYIIYVYKYHSINSTEKLDMNRKDSSPGSDFGEEIVPGDKARMPWA